MRRSSYTPLYGGGTGGDVYRKQRYKAAWVDKIFAVHEKLRSLPPHRKMRCDAFDVAILAVGFRVTRHEGLAATTTGQPVNLGQLERKLECSRKRLKRAAIRNVGLERYDNIAESWSLFRNWARANIFCLRKRRGSNPCNRLRRNQRRIMRQVTLEVIKDDADHQQVNALIDRFRCEIRRGRYPGLSLREFVSNPGTCMLLSGQR